jgi:hypothetical protein
MTSHESAYQLLNFMRQAPLLESEETRYLVSRNETITLKSCTSRTRGG